MAHNLAAINSAYMQAQREVDARLGYSNPYALPIALRALTQVSERLGAEASNGEVVDAAFHGRLRGTVRKVMRARKVTLD